MPLPGQSQSHIRQRQSGGTRQRRTPLLIGLGLIVIFAFGMIYAGLVRNRLPAGEQDVPEQIFNPSTNTSTQFDFAKDQPDGLRKQPDVLDIFAETEPAKTPQSTIDERIAQLMADRELQQMTQRQKMQDEMAQQQLRSYQTAMSSAMGVNAFNGFSEQFSTRSQSAVSSGLTAGDTADPRFDRVVPASARSTDSRTQEINRLLDALARERQRGPATVNRDGVEANARFLSGQRQENQFLLNAQVQPPASRYELATGTIIPGVMISAVNSDLPGDIVAQVTQSVYDTQSGMYEVIPEGTKLFGRYDAATVLGQERLLVVWDRLIFPDNEKLSIGGMQGYDGRGQAGLKDKVRTGFFKTLANAFLISAVTAAGEKLVDEAGGADDADFVLNFQAAFADTTTDAFNEYLRSRLQIKPTIEIRAGTRFNIVVGKDIAFEAPYEYGYTAAR